MITKSQKKNAERIAALADALGHLPYNAAGQTPTQVLNLSIPCAYLIRAEIVTGVVDSYEAVNDQAVADVERTITAAVEYATRVHGEGWWNETYARLFPVETKPETNGRPVTHKLDVRGQEITTRTNRRYVVVAVRPEPVTVASKWDSEAGRYVNCAPETYVAFARVEKRTDSYDKARKIADGYGRHFGAFAVVIDTTTGEEI